MTRQPPGDYDDWGDPVWTPNIHGNSGSAHAINSDAENEDSVRLLGEVVSEVTNGKIPVPTKKGPGFY